MLKETSWTWSIAMAYCWAQFAGLVTHQAAAAMMRSGEMLEPRTAAPSCPRRDVLERTTAHRASITEMRASAELSVGSDVITETTCSAAHDKATCLVSAF